MPAFSRKTVVRATAPRDRSPYRASGYPTGSIADAAGLS
jgi:hypothetical protein